jgi:hypothetical protein
MLNQDKEAKRIEDWLTGGRPRVIRTRGGVRTHGAAIPTPGPEVGPISALPELLERLKAEIPEVPWVVVVDGVADDFARVVCEQAKAVRDTAKFWLISSDEVEISAEIRALVLNPQKPDDNRFLKNLVADLVIISKEPEASQQQRLERWLNQTQYIVVEQPVASLQFSDESRASLFVAKNGMLNLQK